MGGKRRRCDIFVYRFEIIKSTEAFFVGKMHPFQVDLTSRRKRI